MEVQPSVKHGGGDVMGWASCQNLCYYEHRKVPLNFNPPFTTIWKATCFSAVQLSQIHCPVSNNNAAVQSPDMNIAAACI